MKRTILLLMALLCLAAFAANAEAEEPDLPEWTVMFYMCGSDLESRYEYATKNMIEITTCHDLYATYEKIAEEYHVDTGDPVSASDKKVQVVLETGGCKAWHNNEGEIHTTDRDIRTDVLQRWYYDPYESLDTAIIRLKEEVPLQSMADPETLADFIRWSKENYPARKYMLVLWDHGGGSRTGILVDELHDNDIMYLYELEQALKDGGGELEAVLFDACLMANIETACAIEDSARWMIASEEVVTGEGTNILFWLTELCNRPEMDGRTLGRIICDSAQEKCANLGDEQGAQLLTWSVIDLNEIDGVAHYMEELFRFTASVYTEAPELTSLYMKQNSGAERYGSADDRMIDLCSLIYKAPIMQNKGLDMRNQMINEIEKAVVYCVRGSGRARSRGLSFCLATGMTAAELDIYMRNCPSPHYLALLDAITSWTAPDELYEQVERLPEISEIEDYSIVLEKRIGADGTPGVALVSSDLNVLLITCNFYGVNSQTGNIIRLGYVSTEEFPTTDGRTQVSIPRPSAWPYAEDDICCTDMIEYIYGECLYEIPVQIGTEKKVFRCGYTPEKGYEIYGVWAGFDTSTMLFNRNVTSLSKLSGQEYSMLYPVFDPQRPTQNSTYERSENHRLPRALTISTKPLPPGTYYIQYTVVDMFMRKIPIREVEVVWDGENLKLADGAEWEGTVRLN
jgi:hypothetical protein